MSLLVKDLLSRLHSQNITFQYYGSEFEAVYAVLELPEDFPAHSQNGVFYISSDTALISLQKDRLNCVLFTSPDDFRQVLTLCCDYLLWHQQKESLLLQFYEELMNTPAYFRLIRICSSILEHNPVVLLNDQLVPRIHSDDFDIRMDDAFMGMVRRALLSGRKEALIRIDGSENFQNNIFIGIIEREGSGKTEYLCIIEQNDFRYRQDTLHYMNSVCHALTKHNGIITLSPSTPSGTLNELILALLGSLPASAASARIQLTEAGWKEHEQYYVLAIERHHKSRRLPDYTKIKAILETTNLYDYQNYIVAILGCHYFEQPDASCMNALSDYLKAYNMCAGISNGFSEITMLNTFFNQSVKAIEINRFYHYTLNYRVVKYTDFSITHLLEIVSKSSKIKLIDFCHPTLLYILQYDRKNNTDYLNTLSAYILANGSIRLAAQVLYIHTNTMYNRISKIRDDFKLDLDDITLTAQLYISFQILGMLHITDANVWARIHWPVPS